MLVFCVFCEIQCTYMCLSYFWITTQNTIKLNCIFHSCYSQEHILESTDICRLARPPEATPASSEGPHASPSILKKESRISRPVLDSPLKSSPSRGLRNFQPALRFAADSKK